MTVCGCVSPPTRPGDRCNACGYVVPEYCGQIGKYQFTAAPITVEDLRRILREELERVIPTEKRP